MHPSGKGDSVSVLWHLLASWPGPSWGAWSCCWKFMTFFFLLWQVCLINLIFSEVINWPSTWIWLVLPSSFSAALQTALFICWAATDFALLKIIGRSTGINIIRFNNRLFPKRTLDPFGCLISQSCIPERDAAWLYSIWRTKKIFPLFVKLSLMNVLHS